MSVSDHIRIASAELNKAAEYVKQEIEKMRSKDTEKRHYIRERVADLKRTLRSRESDLNREENPNQKAQIQHEIRHIQTEIAHYSAEENELERQLSSALKEKQDQLARLESQYRNISA